ncbi:uncharacterized protein DUF4345 [Litoreibacter ponti]|uniref:Uncharacterized protein DUF4345 n=1 Tax=Litoreibacter ponti TaxID=1510457 RepID=A0A2T6BCJ3_9RHOB|nr:DUF4345 domain-containing protein [Litoreibacter ponti]PTX53783.1 uncharacterized protein DUF4345 [Litoreibacter ponti]
MSITVLEKIALGVSGLTAVGIGAFILAAPHAFFASYGITVGDDASLLSELRAPAAGLASFGVLMLAGIWRSAMTPLAKAAALIVFLAFPAGRIIGLVIDGLPSGPIVGALFFELAVAGLCVVAFSRRANPARGPLPDI